MKPITVILLTIALMVVLFAIFRVMQGDDVKTDENTINVRMQMPGVTDTPKLIRQEDGTLEYVFESGEETIHLTPEEFSQRLFDSTKKSSWWELVFNVSTSFGLIWVTVGLLGQLLFSGRMIVQWLVSEKARRSVVPAAFWWMSLIGASMLLAYFLWRKDLVGVLGQGTGWVIYVRNLWLIHRRQETPSVLTDLAPEPELVEGMELAEEQSEKTGAS